MSALGLFQSQSQPNSPSSSRPADKPKPPKPPVKRVHVDLAGFELDKSAPRGSSTQIGGGTRQIGGDTTLLAPRSARLYTAFPVFQWSHTTQAQNFVFRLFDEKGALLYSAHVSGRQFSYPESAPPLKAGTEYAWSVQPEAALLGGASMTCRLTRLTPTEIKEISQTLEQIGSGGKTQAEQRAQLFTDRRLWFDVVQAYTELIAKYPEDADLHDKRGVIYDQLPVTHGRAEEDFAIADKLQSADVP